MKDKLINSLLKEIELVAPVSNVSEAQSYLKNEPVETIYFGGGTPSLLTIDELQNIMAKLGHHLVIDPAAEITLEANPDDISLFKLDEWKKAGINRLSIGVQSFFDDDLRWMNRAHNAEDALHAVKLAQHAGINNITIDLIYGTPALTDERWKHNVSTAIELGVPHLSCYALTVEPATALDKMIKLRKSPDVDPERQANQFLLLGEWLKAAGYEHYEISNFALPGKRSRHNSSYWQGKNYLGLGPSAHSYNGKSRQWNIANNALYINALANNMLPIEVENLTPVQQLNEYIMTSLRTAEGLSLEYLRQRFGEKEADELAASMQPYISDGKVNSGGSIFQLTSEGMLYADGIASSLFK